MTDIITWAGQNADIGRALEFASRAHAAVNQLRRYTNDPYIVHPIAVATIVASRPHTVAMIQAALLHDVVEDTNVLLEAISQEFGVVVAGMVSELTDTSKPTDGNRAVRKAIDLRHTAHARPESKTVKLADLLDNTKTIVAHDANFAITYMTEKRRLLDVLTEGDAVLWQQAKAIVDDYFTQIGPKPIPQRS